jgi:Sulfotransferase family
MSAHLKVFILGPARSGTSIAYLAMREVFGLTGAGESHVVPLFDQMLSMYETHVARFANKPALASRLQLESFQGLLHDYVRQFFADAYPGGNFVDKTPGPPAGVPFILTLFPDARILLTRRTGIEVVNSHRAKFSAQFELACRLWTRAMADMLALREQPPEIRQALLEQDQFDLTNDAERSAALIAEHLGQPEKASELARFFVERRVQQSSSHDWVKRLTLAETGWSETDCATFVRECGPMMETLGYPM